MSDIVGTPQVGWVPILVAQYNDVSSGTYTGIAVPAGLCVIITDADVYSTGFLVPSDGWQLGICPEDDLSTFNVFYSELNEYGSFHWEGFQKIKSGLVVAGRFSESGGNVGSMVISGYLVQDYTTSEAY